MLLAPQVVNTEVATLYKAEKAFDRVRMNQGIDALLAASSELSRQQIGERMGYKPETARQAISQLLRTRDPQIGTLRRLAKALGVKLESLI